MSVGRKQKKHEEHVNHEAWVIPYADLLTLLLAFFIVMFAMSSINEGKYKELASVLNAAFSGTPTTVLPVQLGENQLKGSNYDVPSIMLSGANSPTTLPTTQASVDRMEDQLISETAREKQLKDLSLRLRSALEDLVQQRLITITGNSTSIEVEIKSDILFESGSAVPSPLAVSTTRKIGEVLASEDNMVRVEGYTDNVPINTVNFRSNWELSAARASSMVHELMRGGVITDRLTISAFGENYPIAPNTTPEGRNANRRVMIVITSDTPTAADRAERSRRAIEAAALVAANGAPPPQSFAPLVETDAAELALPEADSILAEEAEEEEDTDAEYLPEEETEWEAPLESDADDFIALYPR